ncbi:MAG: MraY family glycosyltransferase [Bacillota bacterium]
MHAVFVLIASTILTMAVYRYALAKGVMDIPNSRSSHTRPTPRGGGIAFVITFSVYLAISWLRNSVDQGLVLALVGGGLAIAIVGWIDDHKGLSAGLRLTVHLVAAAWAVMWIRPDELDLGVLLVSSQVPLFVVAILLIAWCTNLFNFMDGIDGIASVEAISCGFAIWLLARGTTGGAIASLSLVFSLAVLGFLPMNWSPARIFMGDVGSGYLGFTLGTLIVASRRHGGPPAFAWLIILAVFLTDATLTLIRRLIQGEPLHEAHRSHVYQLAVQSGFSHRQVSISVVVLNLVLGTLCLLGLGRTNAALMTFVPYGILAGIHIFLYQRWSSRSTTLPMAQSTR